MFIFLVAFLLTVGLAVVFVLGLGCGALLLVPRRTRFIAPFILFIPTLAAPGAGICSWGTGYVAYDLDEWSSLPFRVWLIGFPVGSLMGAMLGAVTALFFSIELRRRRRAQVG